MRKFRWSAWVLLVLAFSGFVLPLFLRGDPREPVASPFARPGWVGRAQPPARSFAVPAGGEKAFEWSWEAPRGLSVSGEVAFSGVPSRANLVWETPKGSRVLLADLSGQSTAVLDLDARDLAFRASIGLDPFDESLVGLFDGRGTVTVRVESDVPVKRSSLAVRIPGDRWGIFGTDQRGRDVFRLFLAGIRVSLLVGILAVLVSTVIGLAAGLFGGYVGGVADALLMRAVDVLLSIPLLPILMVLAALWGKGLWQLVLILGVAGRDPLRRRGRQGDPPFPEEALGPSVFRLGARHRGRLRAGQTHRRGDDEERELLAPPFRRRPSRSPRQAPGARQGLAVLAARAEPSPGEGGTDGALRNGSLRLQGTAPRRFRPVLPERPVLADPAVRA